MIYKNRTILIILFGVAIVIFFLLYRENKETDTHTFYISQEKYNNVTTSTAGAKTPSTTTSGNHSIPLEEIESGGPLRDGIPALTNPDTVSLAQAKKIFDEGTLGIGVAYNGDPQFFPFSILQYHEVINTTVGDIPTLITYCPLCNTGIVYERVIDSTPVEFGVSGLLWESNLLMYNRANREPESSWSTSLRNQDIRVSQFGESESLWSQVLGSAVVGVHTGAQLPYLPFDIVTLSQWGSLFPDTKVLSNETGYARDYTTDPYGDYHTSDYLIFDTSNKDERLFAKTYVLGVTYYDTAKAYPADLIPVGISTDTIGETQIMIEKTPEGLVTIKTKDGTLVPWIGSFWFSWVAIHPDTELYSD